MTVQVVFPGMVKIAYVAGGTALPAIITSLLKVILVAVLAPVRQSLSYGTRSPKTLRPRTAGLEYSSEISVNPATWLSLASGLGRGSSSCASAARGASARRISVAD